MKISIVGCGRLGTVCALVAAHSGNIVKVYDTNRQHLDNLLNRKQIFPEPGVNELLANVNMDNLEFYTDFEKATEDVEIIFIYVPTNTVGTLRGYDHGIIGSVLRRLEDSNISNTHIVIGSTVIPGYIANTGMYLLQKSIERGCTLSYNPEFIAQGDIVRGTYYPDILLIGEGSKEAGDVIEKYHHSISKNSPKICRMSPQSAEITKLGVNCFITTKVAFANMIGDISNRTPGASHHDILGAIGSDSRIGTKYLNYGFGFGGPCFPRDNRALGYYAKSVGVEPTIPEATDKSNKEHTQYHAEDIMQKMESHFVTTAGYKENCKVPIIEESQKLEVAKIIASHSNNVIIEDISSIVDMVENEYGCIFKYSRLD